jgi:hypothetical protein
MGIHPTLVADKPKHLNYQTWSAPNEDKQAQKDGKVTSETKLAIHLR